MELIRGFHNLQPRHHGCVLTIGSFDGVHCGHQALIARTRALAQEHGVPSVALTFEPTPKEFFMKGERPGRISTFRDRIAALDHLGLDRLLIQRFSKSFAAVTAQDFIADLLVRRLGVKAVLIGDDSRFGAQRSGDAEMLKRMGLQHRFSVHGLDTILVGDQRCSSTAIRNALAQPDLAQAAAFMGRPYAITGRIRRGLQLGRQLDMPTANITLRRKPALKLGIYAVRARLGSRKWNGVASLGVRPTLGLTQCLLETHLFESPGDIYGQLMEVEFTHYLRPELKFDSLDALKVQMHLDKQQAQTLLRP